MQRPEVRGAEDFHQSPQDFVGQLPIHLHVVGQAAGGEEEVAVQNVFVFAPCLQNLPQELGGLLGLQLAHGQQAHLPPGGLVQVAKDHLPHHVQTHFVLAAPVDVHGGEVLLEGEVDEAVEPSPHLHQQARPLPDQIEEAPGLVGGLRGVGEAAPQEARQLPLQLLPLHGHRPLGADLAPLVHPEGDVLQAPPHLLRADVPLQPLGPLPGVEQHLGALVIEDHPLVGKLRLLAVDEGDDGQKQGVDRQPLDAWASFDGCKEAFPFVLRLPLR